MRNSFIAVLCCITLLAVVADLYLSHVTPVRAQGGRTVYIDFTSNIDKTKNASLVKTRGATVVGFSCTTSNNDTCFVASE